MKTLTRSPKRYLGNLDFYQFIVAQAGRIKALSGAVLTDAELAKMVVTLLSFADDFNKAILQVQKDQRSEEIVVKDKVRDNSLSAIKAAVNNASYATDPDEKHAATGLTILLDTYGDIARMHYDKESGAIDKLIADLEGATYKPMVEKISIAGKVARLKTDNDSFKLTYNDRRDDSIAAKDALKAIELEKTVSAQYSLLCDYVLLNAKLKTDIQYDESLKIINTIRDEYSAKAAHHKAATKDSTKTKPAKS